VASRPSQSRVVTDDEGMSALAELPRVDGQHRNRALAAARHARAVQLITQGLTYQQVADQMGYANKGTVHHLVSKTLAQTTTAAVQDLRQLEADRLDALQVGLWNRAMDGDITAAMAIIRIIATRCRLFGLEPKP
jgi:AraC-like DNA-binding protein